MEVNRVPQYRMLAKAVLVKALLDAQTALRDEVLSFMRKPLYHTYCDMANVPADVVRCKVINPKNAPQRVDVYQNHVRIFEAQSITDACRFTHDSINAIRRLMVTCKESQRGFKYKRRGK